MTKQESISVADTLRPNQIDIAKKAAWLYALDRQLDAVLKEYVGEAAPLDMLYVAYLLMRIDLEQGNLERYNLSAKVFEKEYAKLCRSLIDRQSMTAHAVYPCDTCAYSPPSSCDGKPCTMCDPNDPILNCHRPATE